MKSGLLLFFSGNHKLLMLITGEHCFPVDAVCIIKQSLFHCFSVCLSNASRCPHTHAKAHTHEM